MKLSATLAAALAALVVVPGAAAAVTLRLPDDIVAEATGPDGATVRFVASAVNQQGRFVPISCTPGGQSERELIATVPFPLGVTTVLCSAGRDGDVPTIGSFRVTVQDTQAPTITGMPGATTLEATGPGGAVFTFPPPSGTDAVDGTVAVTCTPSSGSTFALGTTTLGCSAVDARGNRASERSTITVADQTAPTFLVPGPLDVGPAPSGAGVAATDPRIQAFFALARATDAVDPAPAIQIDAPLVFPVGTTTVRFSAADRFGNVAVQTSTVTVAAPGSPPPPAPPDTAPPGEVTNLLVRAGSHAVTLSWQLPADADFAFVSITRRYGSEAPVSVYSGTDTRFTDSGVRPGRTYTYVVATHDLARNRSTGLARAVTIPAASPLLAPAAGARLSAPPVLRWRPVARATYYNVQLWRNGRKILSAWPARTQFRVPASWRFGGVSYRPAPGRYRWYVWPGLGARSAARYGRLLGQATFVIVRRT